jgi:hypothetical protein
MPWLVAILAVLAACLGAALWFSRQRCAAKTAPPKSTRGERRTSTRVDGPLLPVIVGSAGNEPAHGLVLDRSAGGVRLRVGQFFTVGSVLRVCGILAGDSGPSLQVRVRSCLRSGQSWDVGCQFVRRPSLSQLRLLDGSANS